MARHGRSKHIAPHVGRLSRSQVKGRRGLHKGLKTGPKAAKEDTAEHKEVKVGGDKNGSTRHVPTNKAARYYPAEDISKPKKIPKVASSNRIAFIHHTRYHPNPPRWTI